MPKNLAAIEFFSFIGIAIWLFFYQARSARRSSREGGDGSQTAADAEVTAGTRSPGTSE